MRSFLQVDRKTRQEGFSIAELIVVLSIVGLITAGSIFSYVEYQDSATLDHILEEIELAIREAQVKATSVEAFEDDFSIGYGVFIEQGASEVISFVDSDGRESLTTIDQNFVFDRVSFGPVIYDKQISALTLPADVSIDSICAGESSVNCDDDVDKLNIVFFRATREAYINDGNSVCPNGGEEGLKSECSQYEYAKITFSSRRTDQNRTIAVYGTGRSDTI